MLHRQTCTQTRDKKIANINASIASHGQKILGLFVHGMQQPHGRLQQLEKGNVCGKIILLLQ